MDASVSDVIGENSVETHESQSPLIATPERMSGLLNLETEQVHQELKTVDGCNRLFQQMMEQEDAIRQLNPTFKPDELRMQLLAAHEALAAEERLLQQAQSPEKKGLFSQALEKVSNFPRKHKVLTLILLVAILAGGAIYMSGGFGLGSGGSWWNSVSSWFSGTAAAEGAGEAAAVGAEAAEGAVAAGPDATAAAVEAAKGVLPQTLDIHTVGHSIIYDGQTYSMEQFKDVWPSIVESKGDTVIQVIRDASSRTTTEQTIEELFRESGLTSDQFKWTDNFSNGAAE